MTPNNCWSQCEIILDMYFDLFLLVLALSCQARHLQQLDVAQSTLGKRNRSVTADDQLNYPHLPPPTPKNIKVPYSCAFYLGHFRKHTHSTCSTAYWEDSRCYLLSAIWLEGSRAKQPPIDNYKHRPIRRPHANKPHEDSSS